MWSSGPMEESPHTSQTTRPRTSPVHALTPAVKTVRRERPSTSFRCTCDSMAVVFDSTLTLQPHQKAVWKSKFFALPMDGDHMGRRRHGPLSLDNHLGLNCRARLNSNIVNSLKAVSRNSKINGNIEHGNYTLS